MNTPRRFRPDALLLVVILAGGYLAAAPGNPTPSGAVQRAEVASWPSPAASFRGAPDFVGSAEQLGSSEPSKGDTVPTAQGPGSKEQPGGRRSTGSPDTGELGAPPTPTPPARAAPTQPLAGTGAHATALLAPGNGTVAPRKAQRAVIARPAASDRPRRPSTTAAPSARPPGGWHTALASTYGMGDGFLGGHMACGGALDRTTLTVAHRTLPCGTRVEFEWHGRTVIATVRDRGPYCCGRTWDFGPAAAHALRFTGVGTVRWRVLR